MKTATRPDNLEALEYLLQDGLRAKLSPLVPVRVRCCLKEEILVVLAQHPANVAPDSQQVFSSLERILREQHQLESKPIKIYIRVEGQKQPYAFYSFNINSKATTPTHEENLDSIAPEDFLTETVAPESTVEREQQQEENVSASGSSVQTSPHPWDQPIQEEAVIPEEPLDEEAEPAIAKSKQALLPLLVAGGGLSLFIFFISLFVLTRPCVMGACRAIPQAEELSRISLKRLQQPQSGKEVLEAQEQLTQAIHMLESIPFWSGHHSTAQELLKGYRAQAQRVEEVVTALKTAARAAYRSENPPHPASRWTEIQGMWRDAIARLEQLPTNSNLQPLAQQKIKEYQANLAAANQRLDKERESQTRLQEAKDAALIAEARQGVAQSPEHWQLVYSTWQTAMKRLNQIPQGTTAYEEAQQLQALYTPKTATARDRKTQEQIAANSYNQGLRIAQLAKNSQLENQWSLAVTNWRNALTYINQVPRNTFYYGKAQSLVKPYTNALNQAKGNLHLAVKAQQVRSDLTQTCTANTQVCNFGIINNIIKVRLTPAYTQLVKQTALAAQTRGDSNAQAGIVKHIMTLGEALEAISDNARMPLEVYDSEGNLIQSHNPNS